MIRALVSYDGTDFHGFARQPGLRTVQGELESSLSQMQGSGVEVVCAGRTDAGVHARGQVISFDMDIDSERIRRWAPGVLPADLSIVDCAVADDSFSARFDAKSRSYVYLVHNHPFASDLFLDRFSYWERRPLDVSAMNQALRLVVGTHDFSSFARVRADQSPIRTVQHASASHKHDLIRIEIQANAFLHQMVRSLVGSVLEIGARKRRAGWMRQVLDSKDRSAAGPVASPAGLCLVEVLYTDAAWPNAPVAGWPWAGPSRENQKRGCA